MPNKNVTEIPVIKPRPGVTSQPLTNPDAPFSYKFQLPQPALYNDVTEIPVLRPKQVAISKQPPALDTLFISNFQLPQRASFWPSRQTVQVNDSSGGNQEADGTTPWGVGWEWFTGSEIKTHNFKDGDHFTELLKKHEHIEETRKKIAKLIFEKGGKEIFEGSNHYALRGFSGIPKYIKDYSTLSTGGLTGNLAVTYLGSYALRYKVMSIDERTVG